MKVPSRRLWSLSARFRAQDHDPIPRAKSTQLRAGVER
jgi:hypothetical protein